MPLQSIFSERAISTYTPLKWLLQIKPLNDIRYVSLLYFFQQMHILKCFHLFSKFPVDLLIHDLHNPAGIIATHFNKVESIKIGN